ncbi:ATP-binding protein [Haloarcula salina]|uniref:ATP-binding protein n=1 Tax=Haloarcula salina TaxID=1429914 RepID=UPI003C6F32FF
MDANARARLAPWLLASYGLVLVVVAVGWHLGIEARQLGRLGGPMLALALDGVLPLALVYGGYRLVKTATPGEQIWTVFVWSVVGSASIGTLIGLSVVIRQFEGGTVAEPVFVTLLSVEAGAVAGLVAGYFAIQARQDAERAVRTAGTLSFVNDLLRHDLANGLLVIDGRASILHRQLESTDARNAVEAIREQVTELDRLIDNAGAVAETLAGDATFEPVDVVAVTGEVVDRIQRTRDVPIDVRGPDGATVRANDAVRPVIWNLVENAVEHGAAATDRPDRAAARERTGASTDSSRTSEADAVLADRDDRPPVVVGIEVTADAVEIHVCDDGPGVPHDKRNTIFEARAGETHGGGLHLVETLVDSFDGEVRLADDSGRSPCPAEMRGAHFVVTLPRS